MSTGFCGWMKAGRIACNKSAIVSATMAVRTPFRGTLKKCMGVPFESASLDSGTTSGHAITPASRETSLDRNLLIEEITACLNTVVAPSSPRDQRIFWLYYRAGLSARAIAALPAIGLTIKGVESTLQRLTRQVKERMD